MDDTLFCPICGNKLRSITRTKRVMYGFSWVPVPIIDLGKYGNYIERVCTKGPNHRGLQFFTNEDTKKVHMLKLSIDPKYSVFLEIDFHNERSRISCMKNGRPYYIEIDKLLVPDFPNLIRLKEKINMFVLLS